MNLPKSIAVALVLASLPTPLKAQLLFTLNPSDQIGTPGATVTFNATLGNLGADTVFLNGVTFDGLPASLSVDTTPFFANAPLSLALTESWTGDIFNVQIDPLTPPGPYIGSFSILGGADDSSQDILASQNFLVTVVQPAAVPEPGATGLLVSIAIPIAVSARGLRRRKR